MDNLFDSFKIDKINLPKLPDLKINNTGTTTDDMKKLIENKTRLQLEKDKRENMPIPQATQISPQSTSGNTSYLQSLNVTEGKDEAIAEKSVLSLYDLTSGAFMKKLENYTFG